MASRRALTRGVVARGAITLCSLALASGAVVLGIGTSSASATTPPSCTEVCEVTQDASYILSAQDAPSAQGFEPSATPPANPKGWIGLGPISVGATPVENLAVRPYDDGYAALGLVDAAVVTGDSADAAGALSWLSWYAEEMERSSPRWLLAPGASAPDDHPTTDCHGDVLSLEQDPTAALLCYYVPDATNTKPGTAVLAPWEARSTATTFAHPSENSTDAEASMFLVALDALVQEGGVTPSIAPFTWSCAFEGGGDAIDHALVAIRSTMQPDGLTTSTPWYGGVLLENEAEVAAGLRAASALEATLATASVTSPTIDGCVEPSSSSRLKKASAAEAQAARIEVKIDSSWWLPSRNCDGSRRSAGNALAWGQALDGVLSASDWSDARCNERFALDGSLKVPAIDGTPMANMWAAMWGLVPGHQDAIVKRFMAIYGPTRDPSAWSDAPMANGDAPAPLYWVILAGDQSTTGSPPSVLADEDAVTTARQYQYQPKDAGLAIWAESQALGESWAMTSWLPAPGGG